MKEKISIFRELEKEEKQININLQEQKYKGKFPKEIFKRLPILLKSGCDILVDEIEKEVYFIGAIGVISGLLPNVKSVYDGHTIYPNLYVAVLGKFGSGKGSLKHAKKLGQKIHSELSSLSEEKRPQGLFIPANNSKTGFLELLDNNKEQGIIFETESDTLSSALKADFGNFSDVLRAAFQHETISIYRATEKAYKNIEEPKLSTVLSATPEQFKRLIPSIEDGLFSRFLYYHLPTQDIGFRDVFDEQKKKYPAHFDELSTRFKNIYSHLENAKKEITIELTSKQQKEFVAFFEKWTIFFCNQISEDLSGTVFRLAVVTFRLMMIFTTLRFFEKKKNDSKIILQDLSVNNIDFKNALDISNILFKGASDMYDEMPESRKKKTKKIPKKHSAEQQIKEVESLKNEGLTPYQIQLKLRINRAKYYKLIDAIKKKDKAGKIKN